MDTTATCISGLDPQRLRAAFGQFPTGVTVITTRSPDGRKVGLTANSFSSLSLDPPLVLWSLRKVAPSRPDFVAATHFAINILAHDQIALSRRFATPSADKFDGVPHVEADAGGVPCLDGASARFVCRNVGHYEGGDHLLFIGQIEQFDTFGKAPLVFHAGQYRAISAHPDLSCIV
ncbi:flavin reductase family protein [Burkholderia diffusa]|uniref:flavin reductase family protein n=1 Tax=Burkholderia diffusa TaxID=488732 RepID=UPI00264B5D8D|nr:flavin reductase family protein [Burkholderia diffusa]MDN7908510.1 flavin reductase family protein [Burkholderia diffusa]